MRSMLEGVISCRIIRRGASFCHVASRIHIGHGREDITEGNQKCIGAAPNLVRNPSVSVIIDELNIVMDSGLYRVVI